MMQLPSVGACRAGAIALLALMVAIAVASPNADAAARTQPMFSVANLKRDTRVLSSDAYEGRAPLTPGEEKSITYIARALKRAGVEPGYKGSYFQPVPLLQTETLTSRTPEMTLTGRAGSMGLTYGKDVTLNTRRNMSHIDIDQSGIVFVGFGINAPKQRWNDYAGVDVRGKTVLILINDPDWQSPVGQGPFGGAAMTYYGRWVYKYEEAARQGAAAAIIIHSDAAAGYPFSVVSSSLGGARVSLDRGDEGKGVLAVESWMTHDAGDRLMHLAGMDLKQLEEEATKPGFKARALGINARFRFDVKAIEGVSHNVIGRLAGKNHLDDHIIYTAHWDHLGRCPADRTGDTICNGAIDNATGVAGLLELARAYRAMPRSDRSILFLALTGEEYGLLGSKYYATHPARPLAKTVAEIDLDPLNFMLGRTRDISLIADQTELANVVRAAAEAQGRTVTADTSPEQGSRYRSDTLSFSRAGVPVVLLGNGVNVIGRPAGWGQARLKDYFEHHYHQPSDTYDPHWIWSGALQDLDLYFDIGHRLANQTSWPNWYPNDEFRAPRDAVLAGKDFVAN